MKKKLMDLKGTRIVNQLLMGRKRTSGKKGEDWNQKWREFLQHSQKKSSRDSHLNCGARGGGNSDGCWKGADKVKNAKTSSPTFFCSSAK